MTVAIPILIASTLSSWGALANTQDQDKPLPSLPQPKLIPLDGATDEVAEGLKRQVTQLADAGKRASNPLAKAEHLLAAANVILADVLEPVSTDRFLQIERGNSEQERKAPKEAMRLAQALLEEARASLGSVETSEEAEEIAARRRVLDHQTETLTAFSSAMAQYLQLSDETDSERATRRAASQLSPLLEDANAEVAGAAAFWRACLRSMDEDPAAALSALDPVMTDLPAEGARYAFFSRLLRGRLLARRGGETAALALLMQAEERLHDWFKAEADRQSALRTIGLVQMQILRSWHDRLSAPQQAEERGWCATRMTDLTTELFASESATVMRLGQAIPIVVQPPQGETPPPQQP